MDTTIMHKVVYDNGALRIKDSKGNFLPYEKTLKLEASCEDIKDTAIATVTFMVDISELKSK